MSDDIFGKLPDTRPGVRSPRRGTGGGTRAEPSREPPKPAADAAAVAAATQPAREEKPPTARPSTDRTPADERSAGLEDIAWAGVAAAAEAATLGVRLANRAIEAFRGTSERR